MEHTSPQDAHAASPEQAVFSPSAAADDELWGCESALPYLTFEGGAQWYEHGTAAH